MPQQSGNLLSDSRIRTLVTAVLGVLVFYVAMLGIAELKNIRYIGSGVAATNTITVSGEGDVSAVPDTATFSVTIQETAKDVETAQTTATKKGNDIIAYLKSQGIEDKDIKTADYSIYPQYEYSHSVCPAASSDTVAYCPPGKQTLSGYQVSQTITVKVRDTEKAGTVLSGVGSKGASSVSGLSFTIDNQDALEAEARGKAIDSARAKAEVLAKQLNVSLVRVVGFSENGNYPMYYAKAEMATMSMDSMGRGGAPAPELPTGENKITSSVSVTYEVR